MFLSASIILYALFLSLSLSQLNLPLTAELDFLSLSLVILSAWLFIQMTLANFNTKNFLSLMLMFKLLFLFLCLSFFSSTTLLFYFFFEASLIPIFWIILGWGYQPERALASLMMFLYTLASSLPLLVSLLLINYFIFSTNFMSLFMAYPETYFFWFSVSLTTAFLVKFPMFFFHLWLPKAHVEAPVSGSMILAGILLKLGGYGLYRLAPLFFIMASNFIFSTICMAGGALLGILCCRLSDMKVIIAYSSVVHMSMIILALLGLEKISLVGAWWMMLAHGLVSSGMFAGANIMYEQSHSRSLILNKGALTNSPAFTLFWFSLLMMNFSGPFTLNLFSEIKLILGALSVSVWMLIPIAMLTFFAAAYCLILYASSQQGHTTSNMITAMNTTPRELSILWSHSWPIFVLLFNLSI